MAKKNKSKAVPTVEVKADAAAEVKAEDTSVDTKPTVEEAPAAITNAEPKVTVKIQYAGNEYDVGEIRRNVAAAYYVNEKANISTLDIYIKPEDKAAYYVVNSDISDKIDL